MIRQKDTLINALIYINFTKDISIDEQSSLSGLSRATSALHSRN